MRRLKGHNRLQSTLRQLHPMVPMPVMIRLNRIEADNRRRAKKKGCEREKFSFISVCEEQDWKCSICGKPMNWTLTGNDPNAISLDHVIGLAQGGSHTRKNAAAAHRLCNSQKGHTFDAPNAAKVKRLQGKTGQQARRKRNGSKLQSRGFSEPPENYVSPLSKNHPNYRGKMR